MRAQRIKELTAPDPDLRARVRRLLRYGATVRSSEYHLTNACNIRCQGCWFFTYGHDQRSREATDLRQLRAFVRRERVRGVNSALLIGGEPTLFPERIAVYREELRHVSISTNGLVRLPREGFEEVGVGISLFGGGELDDELRAIKPNGSRFEGLFETSLENYENDPRAAFIYAVVPEGIHHIEPTIRRVRDHGLRVSFNYYQAHHEPCAQNRSREADLLAELLRLQRAYPETVISHPSFIRALITGRTHWGRFGYDVCPSVSHDHPDNADRIANGNPHLPRFNTYSADLRSLELCCTSGECGQCRDSQAIQSWLLVSLDQFLASRDRLEEWVEIGESYWSQFVWSPYHPSQITKETMSA